MGPSNRIPAIFTAMLLLHTNPIISNRVVHAAPAVDDFIRTSCGRTLYPAICLTTLAPLAPHIRSNPVLLASAALNASLAATMVSASGAASSGTSPGPMKVCTEELADAVDELRRSVGEMATLGGEQLGEQVGNLQTWVSAALTDVGTCLDGLRDGQKVGINTGLTGSVGGPLRWRVAQAAQMTSNALRFINDLVAH